MPFQRRALLEDSRVGNQTKETKRNGPRHTDGFVTAQEAFEPLHRPRIPRTFCIGRVEQKIDIGYDHFLTALRHFPHYFFVLKSAGKLQGFHEINPFSYVSQGRR